MSEAIHNFFYELGLNAAADRGMLFGMIIAWIVIIAARIVLSVAYKGQLKAAGKSAEAEITGKEAVEALQPAVFKRAAMDYAELGERGIANIDAKAIATKSGRRLRLGFWSFESIGKFIAGMELAVLAAAVLFALIAENPAFFAGFALITFVAGRLLASFFDYDKTRAEFIEQMAFILEKDLGKLYVTDAAASINNLRAELKNAMTYQAKYLGDSIADLRERLATVSEKTLSDTAAAIESTLKSVSAGAETVLKPLEEWRVVIGDSKQSQEDLNASIVKMSGATGGFKERMEDMDRVITGYKDEFLQNNKNVEESLARLATITDSITDLCRDAKTQTEAVQSTLDFVRTGQQLMRESMNQYEVALKDISAQTGEGLGKIIEYHAQNSYKALADTGVENIKQAGAANVEMMANLQSLFDRLLEQSKNATAVILNTKERMELEIAELKMNRDRQKSDDAGEMTN